MLNHLLLFVMVSLIFTSTTARDESDDCVYTLYVQTGSIMKGGTDSTISVTMADSRGRSVHVSDLRKWGIMGHGYEYFERSNLDIFSGRGPCTDSRICYLNLTSDGWGAHHGWFCEYVEITSTRAHKGCKQSIFYVDQWLANDAPPYELTAVIDGCRKDYNGPGKHEKPVSSGPSIFRKSIGPVSE